MCSSDLCFRCIPATSALARPRLAFLGWKGSRPGHPPPFFAKDVIIKGLRRKIMQGCDSKGVIRDFEVSVGSRRLLEGCGGGPSIHVVGFIAHKCLFVKYLCEIPEDRASY